MKMRSIEEFPVLITDLMQSPEGPTDSLRICLVSVGGEFFALDIRQVQEVFELESVTPVPGMPAALLGVANLRGTIIPLVDLSAVLSRSRVTNPKYVVVVRHGSQQIGIAIDEVPETRSISLDDHLAPSAHPSSRSSPVLFSFLNIGNQLCGVVEVSRMVALLDGAMESTRV